MRSPLIAVAALIAASPALAADIPAQSKIDAVTVFPAGAEVTRTAKVKLSPGDHTVILTDLPANANPSSIRVEGKATGKLEIGSVDSRVLSIPRTDAGVIASERKKIETEIETLKDAKSVLNNQVQTAEAQKALITNLTTLPSRPAPATGAAAAGENWAQMLALIGTSMSDVHKVILETQIKMREIDRKIADLQKKWSETNPVQESHLEVKVFANAGAALDADLVIRYQVANAGWQPQYDARLATGNKTVAPKLSLTRRATITQRTGEAWENIALTLSTARPSASSAAPTLNSMTVDFQPERPPMPAPVAAAPPAPMTRG
ncbi:MAG: mucoidy inhibitor MuiA family protein, partial [Hyphomicrobiaceae bacterium]